MGHESKYKGHGKSDKTGGYMGKHCKMVKNDRFDYPVSGAGLKGPDESRARNWYKNRPAPNDNYMMGMGRYKDHTMTRRRGY